MFHVAPVSYAEPEFQTLTAAALALIPGLTWAWSAAEVVLSWRGFAMFAGFSASGLFAVSMLLMLRLKWLDRVFCGLGHVYQAHHTLGVAGFLLLLAHPLALALAALEVRPEHALQLLWPDVSSGVMVSGWLALFLFVVFFAVTVTPRIYVRLWRRLHRGSGLAYAVMIWHLVAAWSGSNAAALGLALVVAGVFGFAYRYFAQDLPWRGLHYRVVDVRHRAPNVVDITLEPLSKPVHFAAGQFVYMALRDAPAYCACGELHPYTMTNAPGGARLQLSIKALGDCTRHIQQVTPGVEAIVQGPFGGIFPREASVRPQVWIAGGIGVTPFLSRASTVAADDPQVDIVYAAPSKAEALYLEDPRTLVVGRPNMRLHTLFEDEEGLARNQGSRAPQRC